MRTNRLIQCLLLLWVAGLSCGPALTVSSDYDRNVNFSRYKTFTMFNTDSMSNTVSELNKKRIISSIKNEMLKKGFHENTTSPELLVNTVAIFKDKTNVSSTTSYYGYGGFYRPYAWGAGGLSSTTSYNVDNYKDGSLIIDIIDASTKSLIWQGTGNKEIDKPAKDLDKAIADAVASIMASFPPGAAKK